ncbi:MAG: type II secretion system protein GspL [Gammaproteobacteria bacterium]|nr:type II secretion system protein GspL [Gammaproteobacteria bacterium]
MLQALRQTWSRQGNTLEVLLPRGWPENRGIIHWRLRGDTDVAPHGQVTELNQIPGVGAMTRVHVWTPPSESLLTHVTLPTRSRAKIQQALPYALEDQLIGEPDQLHFAYRALDDGNLAVAVTTRARLQAWITQLTDAGLRPTSLCPAQLALPLIGDSWSVAYHEDEIWVRTGPSSGFVCTASARTPPSMLVTALNEAREKQMSPQKLLVIQAPQGFDQTAWSTSLGLPIQVQTQSFWVSHHEPVPALNLLQGAYAPSSQMHTMVPALRQAAIMLAAWLIGSLGFNLWEWWQLKKTHENLRQEMVSLFKRTFPEAQTVIDPALQMQRLISEMQDKGGKSSGTDMLPLLGNIAPVVQASPQLKLRGIQYGESRLTLDVTLPDYQTMDAIKSAFTTRGMQVEVIGANSTPAGIEGRLRLGQTGKTGT